MKIRNRDYRRILSVPLRIEALEPRLTLSISPIAAVVHGGALSAVMSGGKTGMAHVEAAEVAEATVHSHDSVETEIHNGGSMGDMGEHEGEHENEHENEHEHSQAQQLSFSQKNLVSNDTTVISARQQDANLVNAWGIAPAGNGSFWIAENGSGTAELILARGKVLQTITIPGLLESAGTPTGIVVLGDNSPFLLKNGQPATLLLATEDGTIVGWGPSLGSTAEVEVDNSSVPIAGAGAVYKGLAIGESGGTTFIYATNFRMGAIDVFDTSFHAVSSLPGNFTDPGTTPLPALPAGAVGYAPFGIQTINGLLYVTYAAQDSAKHDDVAGAGAGFIDVFNTDGTFVSRIATGGSLNSPWGLALAPTKFGQFAGALLVGNFGDGTINAFSADPANPASLGPLTDSLGNPVKIDGLWGLAFSTNGHEEGRAKLFFTAGPNGESAGLFGRLNARAAVAAEMEMESESETEMEMQELMEV